MVASECAPFVKIGGLADVVGALPIALRALGHDVRVVLPRYGTLDTAGMQKHPSPLGVPMGAGEAWSAVFETRLPGSDVPLYLIEHDALFGGRYVYDPPWAWSQNNLLRFGFLSRAALQLCRAIGWIPDVAHGHDWPTALVPVYLNTVEANGPFARTASVFTVHNLAHQPKFPAEQLGAVGLPARVFTADGLEDFGAINPMKGGLYHATKLTTVSPSYAREVRTRAGGEGLDGPMNYRGADLVGILNGMDDVVWDPTNDPHLPAHFSAEDLSGKAACKRALQRELALEEREDVPLVAMVSRLSWQKGADIVMGALDRILALGAQVVMLGAGERELERALGERSHHGGGSFRAWIGHHEALSHRIEAAADLFMMPSRFEPCGLNQMYSQRYGTLPIVRATGGLDDTVENHVPGTTEGTGFKFWELSPEALYGTVAWAVDVWRSSPEAFRAMQRRAMQKDLSWRASARRYEEVYGWATEAVGQRSSSHATINPA